MEQILSISQLNTLARQALEECLQVVWVEGEISNVSSPSSGHCYFTLKDAQAQVRCALFKMTRARVTCALKDGAQVIVRARVSIYEPRGDYQLIVQDVQLAGLGLLQQQFEALKKKL